MKDSTHNKLDEGEDEEDNVDDNDDNGDGRDIEVQSSFFSSCFFSSAFASFELTSTCFVTLFKKITRSLYKLKHYIYVYLQHIHGK